MLFFPGSGLGWPHLGEAVSTRSAAPDWWKSLVPWQQRELIWQLSRRDLVLRYRGSVFGLAWTMLTPLALLAIYTAVFRHVFKFKWATSGPENNLDFALSLFAGMLLFQWVADLLGRAPRLILEQPHLVKKMVFPLPVLIWAALLTASLHALIAAGIWLIACVWAGHLPQLSWFLLPVVPLSLLPWLLGLGWLLCGLGVFLRDLGQAIGLALSGLLFLTPVFYPLAALPTWMQPLSLAIPLSAPIEALRGLVLLNTLPDPASISFVFASGLLLAILGLFTMHRLSDGFADVL